MKLKLIHTWKKRKWKKGVKREQELTKAKKLVCSFSSRQALAPFCGCLISLAYPLSRVVCVFVCYCCCCCRLGKQLGCDFVSGRNIFFSFHNSSFYLFLLFLRLEEKSCCTFKALQRRTMPRLEFCEGCARLDWTVIYERYNLFNSSNNFRSEFTNSHTRELRGCRFSWIIGK